MNWYKLFYWLVVADNCKAFFITAIVLFSIPAVIASFGYFIVLGDEDDSVEVKKANSKIARKWIFWSYPFMILFWGLYVFTPSKSDTLLIIAGGAVGDFVTSDSNSKAIPADITKFLHLKLQSEVNDVNDNTKQEIKEKLGIQTPKEKLISKVKDMTKEEIIEYLKSDTAK